MKPENCTFVANCGAEIKEKNHFYVTNLDALIAEVESIPARSFGLDHGWGVGGRGPWIRPSEIVAMMPHFRAYGVDPDTDGAPQMKDARGCLLHPDETLDHLFGYIAGGPACAVLFMGYGEGAFDQVLMARCHGEPDDQELFLARLHLARAVLTAVPAPHAPGRPSAAMVEFLRAA